MSLAKAWQEYHNITRRHVERQTGMDPGVEDVHLTPDQMIDVFNETKNELGYPPEEIDAFTEQVWELQGPQMKRVINMALATGGDPIKVIFSCALDMGMTIGHINCRQQAESLRQMMEGGDESQSEG